MCVCACVFVSVCVCVCVCVLWVGTCRSRWPSNWGPAPQTHLSLLPFQPAPRCKRRPCRPLFPLQYPEVLGSILGGLKSIVNVIGMTRMTPPIKELLPRLTPVLKNRHEKARAAALRPPTAL